MADLLIKHTQYHGTSQISIIKEEQPSAARHRGPGILPRELGFCHTNAMLALSGKRRIRYLCAMLARVCPGRQVKMYIFAMPAKSVGHYKRKQAFEMPSRCFMLFIGRNFEENYKSRHIGTRRVNWGKLCFG